MGKIFKGLLMSALLGAGAVAAAQDRPKIKALHPQGTPGEVDSVNFFVCPATDVCVVKIKVEPKPDLHGNSCTFTLSDGKGKEFFYIDLFESKNKTEAEQPKERIIRWETTEHEGWTPVFLKNGNGKDKTGINITEGKDHEGDPDKDDNDTKQTRKIKRKPPGKERRSLLLYDIDVELRNGNQKYPCNPYGPGIINRGT